MRHLKYSDNFLKNNKINEALANDIPWGDSLLGRLINSIIRKAKIGTNLIKIDSVIKSLYGEFDRLLVEGSMQDQDSKNLNLVKLSALLGTLKKSVNSENIDSSELLNITNQTILDIKSSDSSIWDNVSDKDILLKKLEDFKDFLTTINSESKEDNTEEIVNNSNNGEIAFNILSSLKDIINILNKPTNPIVDKKEDIKSNNLFEGGYFLYKSSNLKDYVVYIISLSTDNLGNKLKDNQMSIVYWTTQKKWMNSENVATIHSVNDEEEYGIVRELTESELSSKGITKCEYERSKSIISAPKSKLESLIFESVDQLDTLKKHLNILKSDKDKGIGIDVDSIDDLLQKYKENPNQKLKYSKIETENTPSSILSLLENEIFRYYKGDKSKTISESIYPIYGDSSKVSVLAEKIIRFSKSTILFEENDLYKTIGEVGESIHKFNSLLDNLGKTSERILNYIKFLRINEEVSTITNQIEEKYNSLFDKFDKFEVNEDELKDLDNKIEKSSKNAKNLKIKISDGSDPIMDIVRLFNRAYKIHTVSSIPSGRSDGKISNKVFREYTWMGHGDAGGDAGKAGTIRPKIGAWRNNAIFDKWEGSVLEILSSVKYRPIFNEGTSIQIGNGEPVKNVGKMLLQMINELLDSNEIYKKGQQREFIKRYFNLNYKDEKLSFPGDELKNDKTSKSINEKILEYVDVDKYNFTDDSTRKSLAITFETIDKDKNVKKNVKYFYIVKVGRSIYLKESLGTKFISIMLDGNIRIKNSNNTINDVYICKLDQSVISENTEIEYNRINISSDIKNKGTETSKKIKMKISNIKILKDENDAEYKIVPKIPLRGKDVSIKATDEYINKLLNV